MRVVERLHGRPVDPEALEPATRAWLIDAPAVPLVDYLEAGERLWAFARRILGTWRDDEILVTPTLTRLPAEIGGIRSQAGVTDDAIRFSALVRLWNVTGQPAISLPLARTADGHAGRRPARRAAWPRRPAARSGGATRGGGRLAPLRPRAAPCVSHGNELGGAMHASISHLRGDPDDLLRRYDALLAEVPAENMILHLCLRSADGIVIVDTCPSREVFEAFHAGEPFRAMRARHGLPEPDRLEDYPVHIGIARGETVAANGA